LGRKSSIRKIKRDNSVSKNIEAALCMNLYLKSHSPVTTKFTGMGLSECDVLSISKSDYIYEYEIKISRSDFKKDFIKEKHTFMSDANFSINEKSEQIKYKLPNYFTYITPNNLISIDEVPEYAGLTYIMEDMETFVVVKKPKLLHKTKANDEFVRAVAHNLMCKLVFNKVI
jgi:hypothetical protein